MLTFPGYVWLRTYLMKELTRDANRNVMSSPLRSTKDETLRPEAQEIDDLGSPSFRALLAITCMPRNTYNIVLTKSWHQTT